MSLSKAAFLVMGHNTRNGEIAYDVFSEDKPTVPLHVICGTVAIGYGDTYQEGLEDLRAYLTTTGMVDVIGSKLSRRACQALGFVKIEPDVFGG